MKAKMKHIATIILLTVLSYAMIAADKTDFNSDNPITIEWRKLASVEWVWDGDFYVAKFNEEIKMFDGREVIVEGFMFPLEYTRKHTTFLLSNSPMSNCFFCGPGEAESMIYVESNEALEYNYRPLKMKGTFKLIPNASMGIIYELENATPVQ